MKYGVVGASGRMGHEVTEAFDAAGHRCVLEVDEAGECTEGEPDVIVDFSRPAALPTTLRLCRSHGAALVLGTTGLTDSDLESVADLARVRPVVHSSNFGVGVALLSMILEDHAQQLREWDVEIVEAHHDRKIDAPSGTALTLMKAMGRDCPAHALRLGNLPGDHTIYFARGDELLMFSHRSVNRRMFAQGALRAAEFVLSAENGRYGLRDVLRSARKKG